MRTVNLAPITHDPNGRIKSTHSRPPIKLQAITLTSAARRHNNKAAEQQCNRTQETHRPTNAQSALLRQLKKLGLRTENERAEEPPAIHSDQPSRHVLKRIENCEGKAENQSLDSRASGCKSFMIRKKNISATSKKGEAASTKKQEFHSAAVNQDGLQLQLNWREFKNLKKELNASINSSQCNETSEKHLKASKDSLHSSMTSHNALKVRAIICRTRKRLESIEVAEQQKEQHKQQGSDKQVDKKIDKMIKKVRKLSHLENQTLQPQEKPSDHHLHCHQRKQSESSVSNEARQPLKSEKNRAKGANGCKTVRIFWGESKEQPQQPILQQQEHRETSGFADLTPCKEELFGSISMITRRSDVRIQSLRELYEELNLSEDESVRQQ